MQRAAFADYNLLPRRQSPAAAFALMLIPAGIAALWLFLSSDVLKEHPYAFMFPWTFALGICLSIPSVYLFRKGRFTFADPVIFATWSYLFPAFVVGGMFFAVGWSEPHFLSFIQDISYTLPLTIVLVAIGFAGLVVGYMLPIGPLAGDWIASKLPRVEVSSSAYIVPGILLFLLGLFNTAAAFMLGLFGYQRAQEINSYDGLIYLTTTFWVQGGFLLWFIVFRQRRLNLLSVGLSFLLIITSLARMAFGGARGTVILIFTMIGLAYILSGRKFGPKQGIVAAVTLSILLVVGMIYGTTFRNVKGSEERQSAEQYTQNVLMTVDEMGRTDLVQALEFGLTNLAGRVDVLTTLAVVVSNYEMLAPYEEAYGLDNNIWRETSTFFIPRLFWADKPVTSDARRYSELYFDFGESSFAITAFGDLLRNFGMIGVPIGMFVLGVILRVIYRALVEGQLPSPWRATLYFMLLTSVSYEAFYSTIIPNMFKVGLTAIAGTIFIILVARLLSPQKPRFGPA